MDPNDNEAFVGFIEDQLRELGESWMIRFILEHAWEQVSEEFNNEWINHCASEDDEEPNDG